MKKDELDIWMDYIHSIDDPIRERDISKCGDCGVIEGELHHPGCDMERCPKCGNQLLSCCCWQDTTLRDIPNRVPYICYPNICARCGKLWPDIFMVPDKIWEKYIQISERDKIICWDCFQKIKRLIDGGNK